MTGFRWCARTAVLLLVVCALSFGWRQAVVVSAKDNDQPAKKSASGARDSADSKDSKTSKDKKSTTSKKKAESNKKSKKGAEDTDSDSNQTSQGPTGAGGVPGAGQGSSGASGKSNSSSRQASGSGASGGHSANGKTGGFDASRINPALAGGRVLDANHPLVKKAIEVQSRHQAKLLGTKGIVGVGTGIDDDGNIVIHVCTTGADSPEIPKQLEGIAVVEKLTGPVHPLQLPGAPLYQTRLPRPVPIGISCFDDDAVCAAGTLGCRVKDNHGSVFILSNNHVLAGENLQDGNPVVGVTPISQPASLDLFCFLTTPTDHIGVLAGFVPIDFTFAAKNVVDCAVAKTSPEKVNTSTLKDGYGVPLSSTTGAFLGQHVQKYGRTTGHTTGTVTTINFSVVVGYTFGIAGFVDQIVVTPDPQFTAFSIPGDSGSLVVDDFRRPVALLFAGNGFLAACNPIDAVLSSMSKVLQSTPGLAGDTVLSIDDSPATPLGKEGRADPDSP